MIEREVKIPQTGQSPTCVVYIIINNDLPFFNIIPQYFMSIKY